MAKFTMRFLYLVVPVLLLVLCVTIGKDPGEIITQRYLKTKDIIISGQNARLIAVPSQWGKFQEAFVKERNERALPAFDIVTWGSSRSSEMRSELFPSKSYYACIIPGANVLDYVAIYELYKKNNFLPKSVIINIDPWTFHSIKYIMKDGQSYCVRDRDVDLVVKNNFNSYLKAGMKTLGYSVRGLHEKESFKNTSLKYLELVSPSYFQSSMKVIANATATETKEDYIDDYFVLRKDGSYTLYEPNLEEVKSSNSKAANYGKLVKGDFYGDDAVDGENVKLLTSLLDKLKAEHVNVVLFISPIHPSLYDAMEGYEEKLVEKKLNQFAKESGVHVIGTYNPHVYNLNAISSTPDFIDEYHITYHAMKAIFRFHQSELDSVLTAK